MKKILSALLPIVLFLLLMPPASVAISPDTVHLEQAKESINSTHYRQGYLQFKKMAQGGCPLSQCLLGIMHKEGVGTKKNASAALYWFKKSAGQGFGDAEWRLGSMYYRGDGVKKNLVLAKQWLSRALNHGVEESRQLLAQIPGENSVANKVSSLPQQTTQTVDTIRQSWQGYSAVVKQLEAVASAAGSQ